MTEEINNAIRDRILAEVENERLRQISMEGWTPEHDDRHTNSELADAAAAYASDRPEDIWPWDWEWWKPTTRRRDLIKAAALLVAEVERLDRAALVRMESDDEA